MNSDTELKEFWRIIEGVIKPLGGKGGEDIYFTEKRNLRNNLRALLKQGPILIQSYIPNNGDKRILLLDGEPIAWYLRVANEGEFLWFRRYERQYSSRLVRFRGCTTTRRCSFVRPKK